MSKLILKNLFALILFAPTAFADDSISPFNLQGDFNYPEPLRKESYFATPASPIIGSHGYSIYFGVNAGANITSLKFRISEPTINAEENKVNHRPIGYAAGIYGGLGVNFNHLYIGAELSGGYNKLNEKLRTTLHGINNEISIKQTFGAGIDFIPGYLTQQKNFLLYGRIGLGTSSFKLSVNKDPNSEIKNFRTGWRAGLGMEYYINDFFGIRIEYVLNNYGSMKKTYQPQNDINTYVYRFTSLKISQLNLGLTLRF